MYTKTGRFGSVRACVLLARMVFTCASLTFEPASSVHLSLLAHLSLLDSALTSEANKNPVHDNIELDANSKPSMHERHPLLLAKREAMIDRPTITR